MLLFISLRFAQALDFLTEFWTGKSFFRGTKTEQVFFHAAFCVIII